jgi:hypothetical protein
MAGPIYKLWLNRLTEAWYQLSEEEQKQHFARVQAILDELGAKSVVTCTPTWSAEQWTLFGVTEFPNIEAVQASVQRFVEIGHYRYIEAETILGTEYLAT